MSKDDEHIKKYERERKRSYRERHRTFQISLPLKEADSVEQRAKEQGHTPTELIYSLLRANLSQTRPLLPPSDNLRGLLFELRKIGVNINQTVRYANTYRELSPQSFNTLQNLLLEMEVIVRSTLEQPKTITEAVEEHLKLHPEDAKRIHQLTIPHLP